MGFPVKHLANTFLQRDFEDGCATLSPMKLQKLIYCLHGWHLAITGYPAVASSEDRFGAFDAWKYGPVEEDLYHMFKQFGGNPITEYASSFTKGEPGAFVVAKEGNGEFYDILDFVAQKYMPFTAVQLSALTHQKGTPWDITRNKREDVIPDDLVRKHFVELAS